MITIRPEKDIDHTAIWQITKDAFAGKAYAGGDEQDLINNLRSAGVLALSLVAVEGETVVGHVAYSPATICSGVGLWYGLGPIAVAPEHQKWGIGGKLIEAGFQQLTTMGANGCVLVGDPRYYSRHGFELAPQHCPDNEPETNFMLKHIDGPTPVGKFGFHPIFYDTE